MTAPALSSAVRLNLGCGQDLREGFVNVDKYPSDETVVQADLPIIPFLDSHADEVLLSHVLEHFGFAEGRKLCQEIHRVLRPGGLALIEVPDVAWCMAQFLGAPESNGYTDPTGDYSTDHRWGLYAQAIWGDQYNDGLYHKWGYSAHRLLHLLADCGFGPVEVSFTFSHSVQCLLANARKPGCSSPSIRA